MNSSDIEEYRSQLDLHGVVHIQSLLDGKDLIELDNAISKNMQSPSPFGGELQKNRPGGSFFMDFNNWNRIAEIFNFIKKDKVITLVKNITRSKSGFLFHDHVLVKQGSSIATPWHQDRPYYIFKGDLNLSIWMPSTSVPRESSLLFWSGSHKQDIMYMPKGFADGRALGSDSSFEELDPDKIPASEILDFEMNAGDAIIFYNNTVHGSRPHQGGQARKALSIRMLLDGARLTTKYINATPPFDRMGVNVVEDGDIPARFPALW